MLYKSTFHIRKMDCPSEESMIRMQLDQVKGIRSLDFDLSNRMLDVYHEGGVDLIEQKIGSLNLASELVSTAKADPEMIGSQRDQRRVLWIVLWINFGFFLLEMATGWIAGSMGLVADSLDMLADAFVYGISLYAVGKAVETKKRIATTAGYFQLILAMLGFIEVIRRFFFLDMIPQFGTMIMISFLALLGNGLCLYLLNRSSGKEEAHMKASMIFTSNDILINIGVILSGVLVFLTHSKLPDLMIGAVVFVLVVIGALRILKLGK